jgi:hypothetical protein
VVNIKSGLVECEAGLNDVDTETTTSLSSVVSDIDIVDELLLDGFEFTGCKRVSVIISF